MGVRRKAKAPFVAVGARVLAFAVLLLMLCACGSSNGDVAIPMWTMAGPSQATIALPAHLDDRLAAHPSTYTLTATVALPPSLANHALTFALADLPTLASLRVNGVAVARIEDVQSERYRGRGPIAWRIPAPMTASPSLVLELTVENTWAQSGWFDCVPHLSATSHGDRWYVFVRGWNDGSAVGALGTLTPLGFTYLAMYLLDRRRRAHGLFAVQALAASFLPFFQLGFSQVPFGKLDAPILAVAVSGAAIGSVYFTHAHFGLPWPSRWWALLMGLVIASAVVWPGPFVATSHVGPLIVATFQIVCVHQLIQLGRLSRRRPRPLNALVFLFSWFGLAIMGADDCLAWLGIGEELGGIHAASAGLAFFGVLQSLALSREHVLSLRRSDELNVQLQARVGDLEARQGEIDALNEELRRQIAERSGQLADALARLGSTDAPKPVPLQPGDVIKTRYEVARELGSGAMGTVYEVARLGDRKRFAMKVLTGVSGVLDMARFAREAQIASHVHHPNVVSIVDIDVAHSGLIYIVMELVDGPSLLGLRAKYGETSFALDVLLQLAEGLAAIHDVGIVHRDLKPANVLVKQDATGLLVKISDFGVSTIADAGVASDSSEPPTLMDAARKRGGKSWADATPRDGNGTPHTPTTPAIVGSPLTETGALLGTPIYMAPELAWGAKHAQPPCDVFSLGVIAHELLRGKRPWDESPAFARLRGASVAPAAPLASLCPGLDASLGDALDACLSASPEARPTARALAAVLRSGLHAHRAASAAGVR